MTVLGTIPSVLTRGMYLRREECNIVRWRTSQSPYSRFCAGYMATLVQTMITIDEYLGNWLSWSATLTCSTIEYTLTDSKSWGAWQESMCYLRTRTSVYAAAISLSLVFHRYRENIPELLCRLCGGACVSEACFPQSLLPVKPPQKASQFFCIATFLNPLYLT